MSTAPFSVFHTSKISVPFSPRANLVMLPLPTFTGWRASKSKSIRASNDSTAPVLRHCSSIDDDTVSSRRDQSSSDSPLADRWRRRMRIPLRVADDCFMIWLSPQNGDRSWSVSIHKESENPKLLSDSTIVNHTNGVVDMDCGVWIGWNMIQYRSLVSYTVWYACQYVTEKQAFRNGKKTTRQDQTNVLRRIVLFFCLSLFGPKMEKTKLKRN